jgi:hypothetical protein
MTELSWHEAVELIEPYVVKISTPIGSGSGFLFAQSSKSEICAVATAAHVVNHSHLWQQPIRILHYSTGKIAFLKEEDRAIILDNRLDTAAIVFQTGILPFPTKLLPLAPEGKYLKRGVNLGWVGYPAVSPDDLCFFNGCVSVYLEQEEAYLVDGVAINGVSGGPAFELSATGGITLAGVISAYIPNRATSETLPGLSMASDVAQLQGIVSALVSFDEAKQKESSSKTDNLPDDKPNISGA